MAGILQIRLIQPVKKWLPWLVRDYMKKGLMISFALTLKINHCSANSTIALPFPEITGVTQDTSRSEQLSGYSSGNDYDFRKKPPFGQGSLRKLQSSLWLVPVLRYLIIVNGDSIQVEADPVVFFLAVILHTSASWWFHEQELYEFLDGRQETVIGDPVLLDEIPSDMDGGPNKNPQNNNGADVSDKDSFTSNSQSPKGKKNQDTNQGDEDEPNDDQKPTAAALQENSSRKNLAQLLIRKIQDEDEISVFCLLHYSHANPNQIYNEQVPIRVAYKTKNMKILKLLFEYGAISPCSAVFYELIHSFEVRHKDYIDDDCATKVAVCLTAKVDLLKSDRCINRIRGQSAQIPRLSHFMLSKWDGHHWVRVMAFETLKQKYSLDCFFFERPRPTTIFLQISTLPDENNLTTTSHINMGHLENCSIDCFRYLLHAVEYPFTLQIMHFFREMTQFKTRYEAIEDRFLNEIINMGLNDQLSIRKRGEFLAKIHCKDFDYIYPDSLEYVKMCRISAQERLRGVDLNTLSIEGLSLFGFIMKHSGQYSWQTVKKFISEGLVPWPFEIMTVEKKQGFLLHQLTAFHKLFKSKYPVQYSCIAIISQSLSSHSDIIKLPLPDLIFKNIFRKILFCMEVEYSDDEKRKILKDHFSLDHSRHISTRLMNCLGYGGAGFMADCYIPREAWPAELWGELVDLCPEELDDYYPDDVIEEFEYELNNGLNRNGDDDL